LNSIQERLYYSVRDRFSSEQISLGSMKKLLKNSIQQKFLINGAQLKSADLILKAVHPDNILKRGFSYVTTESGDHITTKKKAIKEKEFTIHFKDGKLNVNTNG